jgi:tyrosine-protein kinase Etk/Wzc
MSQEIKEQVNEAEDKGINLLDWLIILAKWKKLIIYCTLAVAIISGTLSILSSVSFYQATTSILPPQSRQMSFANQFIDNLGLGSFMGREGGTVWNQRLLVELITSKAITSRLIERFNLQKDYDAEDRGVRNRNLFLNKIKIKPSFDDTFNLRRRMDSPLITITVTDDNPEKAAEIANAVVEELKNFVNNIAISEASQRRLFFEEQLKQANEALIKSEDHIKGLQEKTGILEVKSQTEVVIQKIANIEAQIIAQEVQLQVMKSYSTASNPDVQKVEETIKGLKKELAKLESSQSNSKGSFMATGTIPSIGLEYKRIYRELKFNEALYEIMLKQYEAAKIDEAKDATIIQVIDKAVPPKKRSKTRTWGGRKALGVAILAFFFSCFLAFFMEFRERSSKHAENRERIETLKKYLSFKE